MKKNLLLGTIFLFGLFFSTLSIVNAADLEYPLSTNRTKFTRGVTNTCYYVDSSANAYTSKINEAARSWASLNNPIKNTAVASNKGTHIDFYARTVSQDSAVNGTYAYTALFDDKGVKVPVTSSKSGAIKNYYYADIVINKSKDANKITSGIMGHEMGHAYGLVHLKQDYTIMYPGEFPDGSVVTLPPKSVDNYAINVLY